MPSAHRPAHRPPACALLAAAVLACLVLAGCGGGASGAGNRAAASGSAAGSDAGGRVTVLAAASLTEAFGAIARQVERDHPGTDVEVSFAASSTIVQQVNQGAPADVIALAGQQAMAPLDRSLLVPHSVRVFARNSLEIATPASNAAHVSGLTDLADPATKVVLCAEEVPCGAAARTTLAKAGVDAHVVSYERDVKAALAKVQLGEADAAIVYHSDVATAGENVRGVPIPPDVNEVLRYPIARLDDAPAAHAFVRAVLSPEGQQRLRADGFETR
ncbi:MAG TPA: molybdate ABC transporter substrate-binding protein [Segeticoccus sp.]|nr:molybdate ABC transporter substrate-binding protein [Segeticoccus sp.]